MSRLTKEESTGDAAMDEVLGAMVPKGESLEDEVKRLREALEAIAGLDKMTMLCDPADFDFDAEEAYSAGATNAFCDAASTARNALAPKDGTNV